MKKTNLMISIIIFLVIILIVAILIIGYKETMSVKKDLMYMFSESEVIKENFGDIKDVKIKFFDYQKIYNKIGGNSKYINCSIKTQNDEYKKIKVIFNKDVTGTIYAYEIDGELIYENIKTNISFDNLVKSSEIIRDNIGDFQSLYRPYYASYKKYKDTNYWACDYIIIINNGKSKHIKILVDENNSDFIYAYEIDGELIYENNEESIEKQ